MENEIHTIKDQLEKRFNELSCHIVQHCEYDLFEDIRKKTIQKWKEEYILQFDKIKKNDPEYIDDWKCLKVIEAYKLDFCYYDKMIEEIKKIYRSWDLITRSIKYCMVQASLEMHVCEFWDVCKESCHKNEDEKISDWSKLSLNRYGEDDGE